jgi:ABC-type amino acid transport substrate-binding protein
MSTLTLSTHHRLSPIFVAGLAFLLAMLAVTSLAAAHVVQVTTAIDIADVNSPHDFERALAAAVEDAANEAIGFEPAVVALTGMRIIGDRVLVGILFADEAGKEMLEGLAQGGGDEQPDEDSIVKPTKIEI